jgi:hypothetical protein
MGIYYSENGSSFTSTLDIRPKTFFNNDDLNLDISFSDFLQVCNLLNDKKKDVISAIIIQTWWKNIQSKKNKQKKSAIIIQRWWRNIQNKLKFRKNNVEIISIWYFLLFL